MSLFNKFKRKTKKPEVKKDIEKKSIKDESLPEDRRVVSDEKEAIPKKKLSKADIRKTVSAYNIIKEPCITEKASLLAEQNKYVFKVYPNVNKIEIRKAVELVYNTKVSNVRIIHSSPKKRRLGKHEGWRNGLKHGFKKAIVTLKKGEKIELLLR